MISLTDAEIRRLYESGKSAARIAALAGTSRHTIYRNLADQGVPRRATGSIPRNVDNATMARLYQDGVSMAEIGRCFDLPRQVVAKRLMALGVHTAAPRRSPRG